MNKKSKTNISKYISYVLRHNPKEVQEKLNLPNYPFDEDGFVSVKYLLQTMEVTGNSCTADELQEIVDEDSKGRYSFNDDFTKIRANQGHSAIEIKFPKKTPPDTLYHGTASRFIASIKDEGLKKMKRHHVHLSDNLETASDVGVRHGKLMMLTINAKAMFEDGFEFFLSDNGVWLTDNVPVKYFSIDKKRRIL